MYQATLTAGQTGAPQAAGIGSVAKLTISSGSGYAEYTTGSFADIGNGVATWTTWPKGTVSATTQDTAGVPLIVRFTCVTGTVAVLLADPSEAEFPSNALMPWESLQPSYARDASGNVTGLVGPDGSPVLLLSATGLAAPLIVGHDNQTYTRNSANTAADNTFATLTSFTLPAGCMGPNGTLIFEWELQSVGVVQAVGARIAIGGVAISAEVSWAAASTYDNRTLYWFNTSAAVNKFRGSTVRQGQSTTGFTATAIDTAVSNTVDIQCRWAGAASAHAISLNAYRAVVEFGA